MSQYVVMTTNERHAALYTSQFITTWSAVADGEGGEVGSGLFDMQFQGMDDEPAPSPPPGFPKYIYLYICMFHTRHVCHITLRHHSLESPPSEPWHRHWSSMAVCVEHWNGGIQHCHKHWDPNDWNEKYSVVREYELHFFEGRTKTGP